MLEYGESYARMLWLGQEMKKAYPWLSQWHLGVLETRHNQEETPMQQDSGSSEERPDRSLPL